MANASRSGGSVYQRSDGRWVAQIDLDHAGGKRRRKYLYGASREEVEAALTRAHAARREGRPLDADPETTGAFLQRWLGEVATPRIRPKTRASYAQVLRLSLLPELGNIPLEELKPRHVQDWLEGLLARGLSPRTALYARAVLRRALKHALTQGAVARNVATLIDPPRLSTHEVRPLTPEQAAAFLGAARGDRLEALFATAVALGLRQGELLGLRWDDLDLADRSLRAERQLQRIDGAFQLVGLKTPQSRRTIAIPATLVAQLREHRARQEADREAAGERWVAWDLVFPSTIGTPLDQRNLTRQYKALLARAGLPNLRFHDLRHTCASLLLAVPISRAA